MQRGLTNFLLVIVVLAVVYGISAFFWTKEESLEPADSSLVFDASLIETTLVSDEPEDEPSADVGALVSPEITWLEYPGRRVVLEGEVSTTEERRALEKILASVYSKDTKFDNHLKLDQNRTLLAWRKTLAEIDLSGLNQVWDLKCELSNTQFRVTGKVDSQAVGQRLLNSLESRLPEGVSLSHELEAGERPKPTISVWMAPDMTYLLTGSLPEGMASEMLTLVKRSIPAGALVVDDLNENRFAQQPDWLDELQGFLPGFLQETQRSGFSITKDNRVKIEGIAKSSAIPGLRRRLVSAFPSPKFKVESDLQLGVSSGKQIEVAPRKMSFRELVATSKIYFRSGRSRVSQLTTAERAKLDRLGQQWMNENISEKLYVFGFTDASGDAETNAYVSKARCQNVVSYLTKNFGIDKSYFAVVGTPEGFVADPQADADSMRRVEFSLTEQPSTDWLASAPGAQPKTVLKPVSVEDLLVSNKIYFTSKQVTPSRDDRKRLADLASALVLSGNQDKVVLYGYSDGKGKAAANRWFTEERCRAVAKALRQGGLPESQIVMRPVIKPKTSEDEDDDPQEDDDSSPDDEEGAENPRRVELKLEAPTVPGEDEESSEIEATEESEEPPTSLDAAEEADVQTEP